MNVDVKIGRLLSGIWICLALIFLFSLNSPWTYAASSDTQTTIAVFVRMGCTHCQDEEVFLTKLSKERGGITTRYYKLENQDDREVWDRFTTRNGIAKVTPITIIGETYIIGFGGETSGQEIRRLIKEAKNTHTLTDIDNPHLKAAGQKENTCREDSITPCALDAKPSYIFTLPFLGNIDAQNYPLILLSGMLGFFDGFNPCAMWVLITFLVILIEVGNRRKMIVFAGTFVLAEAIMYSLILTLWYKTWDFVKLDTIITPLVGGVSMIGGLYFLNEWRKKEIECRVTDVSKRTKIRQKIQVLAKNPFTLLTFLGILGIAFSVNIIEFACSIGIPQAFTKILELNHLPLLGNVLMIATYILFYMIDDLIVFGIAIWGIDKMHITTRYTKLSNLLGGIVMIALGLILIFKHQLVLF